MGKRTFNSGSAYIDCFTSLDELTRKQQGDIGAVLRVLHKAGRFSVFDATENNTIARTLTIIGRESYIKPGNDMGFPWVRAVLTAKGREAAGLPPKAAP